MKINTAFAFCAALGLHLAVLAVLIVNVSLDKPERPSDEAGQIMHAVMISTPPARGSEQGKAQNAVEKTPAVKPVPQDTAAERKKAEAELAAKVAQQQAQEAKRQQALALKKKQEAERKARQEAERKAKAEAEAKAKAEAAAKAKAEAEAKAKAEAEAKAKREAEAKAKREAEAKAKAEAEAKAKAAAEAARLEEELLGTASGSSSGSGLGGGAGVSSEYGAKVQQLIEQNWRVDPSMNGKQVVVTVSVDAQGMISGEKCTGDQAVCDSALATLQLIGMLPRPPAKCPDCNTIVITMTPKI